MKQVKTTLLIAIIALGFTQLVQAQKVAHINLDEVVASMPEAKAMQVDMEKLGKSYEAEIQSKSNALKAKYERYNVEQASKTPEENKLRATEVEQERLKIQQLNQAASQELQKRQNEMLEPIVNKAQEAIKAYAKEKGIQYILDARTLIYAEGEDISGAIKTRLGIVK